MSHQQFAVAVASEEPLVRERLNDIAQNPQDVVRWFTKSDDVTATVVPSGDLWLLEVEGGTFRATGTVELRPRVPGTLLAVTLNLNGKGFFGLASPFLALAGGKIEGEVRRALHREFGAA